MDPGGVVAIVMVFWAIVMLVADRFRKEPVFRISGLSGHAWICLENERAGLIGIWGGLVIGSLPVLLFIGEIWPM